MLACENRSVARSSYRSGLACRLPQPHFTAITRGVEASSQRSLRTAPCASVFTRFEAAASGEWEGVTASFDARGRPLELPYNQVPAAFREWGIPVQDWQTQCSMTASDGSLTYRLRRLLPVAGCEEDSISFEEESFTSVSPHLYEACAPEAQPGSYALALQQSNSPNGRLRMEHCLMVGEEERLRIVQHAVLGEGPEALWEAGNIELHHEVKEGPFRHGAPLGGCVASMAHISNAQPADHNHWQAVVPMDLQLQGDQGNGHVLEQYGISVLPKGCWCQLLTQDDSDGRILCKASAMMGSSSQITSTCIVQCSKAFVASGSLLISTIREVAALC